MVLGCKIATLLSSDGDSSTIKRLGLIDVSPTIVDEAC